MSRDNKSHLSPSLFAALVKLVAELTRAEPRDVEQTLYDRGIICLKDFVRAVYKTKERDQTT